MSATNHPFPRCTNGHDLSGDDAWVYDNQGYRKCRICASEQNRKRREKVTYGAFDGGMAR